MKRKLHVQGLEDRTVPAVAVDSAYEVYAWSLINELRENPTLFADNLQGLVNNTVNSAFGFSRTDPVIADLRTAINNAGSGSLYGSALALMRSTAGTGPLAWSDELETRANGHNDWMRLRGFAHTDTVGQGQAIPGYTNVAGTTDSWGTYGTFTGFGENIGYNLGGLVNSKNAYNAGTFGLAGFQQRAAFLDTVGFMLELNSSSLGHLRNLLGRDAGSGGSLPSYNTIGLDVDLYQAPAGYEVQDSVPEAWISTHRLGFNNPAGNGGYVAGLVYRDANNNGFYDVGEAVDATIDVRTSGGAGFTYSLVANTHFGAFSGYVDNGSYTVTATVNGVVVGTRSVNISNSNGWAEFKLGGEVVITAPTGTVNQLRPTTTWNAVPGAASYQIAVLNKTTNANNLFPNSTSNTESWTPPSDLVSGQTFRVSVRAVFAGGSFGSWTHREFTIGTPTMTSPSGTANSIRPTISWNSFDSATKYGVWVNDITGAKSNIFPSTVVNGTSWVVPKDLVSGRTYRVWVRALNSANLGAWGTPVDFVVGKPTVTAPTGTQTTLRPTFNWTPINNATGYYVLVTNTTTGKTNLFPGNIVTGTSWTATSDLVSGNNYRVWVRALNSASEGLWSSPLNFSIGKPIITSFSTTNTLTPTISWSAITGASNYEIWLNDVTGAKSNLYPKARVNSTSWTPPANLINGRTYTFWVRALTSLGGGQWSTPMTFQVVL